MNYEEFVRWTEILVELGRLTPEQADDVRQQRRLFDEQRSDLEREYTDYVVGFVAEGLVVGHHTKELLDLVVEQYALQRQLYYESIGPRNER